MMFGESTNQFLGGVGMIEPIIASGKSLGIKLLSVYDFLRCEVMYRNLVIKLMEQNMDKKTCERVCEEACVVSMCLYNKNNERVFPDGLSVLMGMTPDELQKVYNEYTKLNKKVIRFNTLNSEILESVRTSEYKKIRENKSNGKGRSEKIAGKG